MTGTVQRKIKDLHENIDNPRTISDGDFRALRESVKRNPQYFESRPVVLSNRTGKLVMLTNTQRVKAAKANGRKTVPTFLIEGLTEEQEKEITALDNIPAGEWDMVKLTSQYNMDALKSWGFKPPVLDSPATTTVTYNTGNKFRIKVQLADAAEQQKLFDELTERGFTVKKS